MLIVAMVSLFIVKCTVGLVVVSFLLLVVLCMCRWHNWSKQVDDRSGTNHTTRVHSQRRRQCSSRPGARHCMCYVLICMMLTVYVLHWRMMCFCLFFLLSIACQGIERRHLQQH